MLLAACGSASPPPSAPQDAKQTPVEEVAVPPAEAPTAKPAVFPADWVGKWHGTLHSTNGKKSREFAMILEIAPKGAGRYQWKITYALDSGSNVRDYELIVDDSQPGQYQIDEKNGIVLKASFIGQTLYTLFDVGGTQIDFRYSMTDEGISVDVLSSKVADATTTGGGEVPEVKNLPVTGVQHGILRPVPSP